VVYNEELVSFILERTTAPFNGNWLTDTQKAMLDANDLAVEYLLVRRHSTL